MTERLARVEERLSRLVIARETVEEVLSGPAAGQSQVCQPSLPATEVPVQTPGSSPAGHASVNDLVS